MPIRIEIELTSSSPDGSWTWRAAGAREPRGVLDGSILPGGSSVGDQLRVETEHDVEGIRVLSVVPPKEKAARSDRLELLPTEDSFQPVIQQRVTRDRSEADGGTRRPRRDRDDSRDRRDRGDRGARPPRGDRPERSGSERQREPRPEREGADRRRHRPHFTPPPELPQRPKPKRLRPGKQRRADVLASLPEEQRPIAELAVQGISAVRQRLREDNARLRAEGKPEMPEPAVMRMAEELIPRLRVADWLDRAEAAQRQLEHLDLRDLRSVVASADDPVVARDESTREIAAALKAALLTKQEEELTLWLADVEAALDVGRVVRALRLSSVPPKAGVPFPGPLAARLAEATTASLQPGDGPDRWAAVLEAVAFSPVRALVTPAAPPEQRADELTATVRRLAPLLPQVAAIFDITVAPNTPVPKPLRPTPRRPDAKKAAPRPPRPTTEPAAPATSEAPAEAPEVTAATVPPVDDPEVAVVETAPSAEEPEAPSAEVTESPVPTEEPAGEPEAPSAEVEVTESPVPAEEPAREPEAPIAEVEVAETVPPAEEPVREPEAPTEGVEVAETASPAEESEGEPDHDPAG